MYDKKLQKVKLSTDYMPIVEIEKLLDGFATREALLNVPQKELFRLFDEYCESEKGFKLSHKAVGRAIRKKYNFKSRPVRYNGEIVKVYVEG